MKAITTATAVLLLLTGISRSQEDQGPQVGKPAPEIVGFDTDGVNFKLSDYKGKVILLDFWGNW
jgi:cytochrome oxidase Cu insertion factor (SCO1/SenC/PrrC family)